MICMLLVSFCDFKVAVFRFTIVCWGMGGGDAGEGLLVRAMALSCKAQKALECPV